jgi:hypothetical protein
MSITRAFIILVHLQHSCLTVAIMVVLSLQEILHSVIISGQILTGYIILKGKVPVTRLLARL